MPREPVPLPKGKYLVAAQRINQNTVRYEVVAGEFKGSFIFGPRVMQITVDHKSFDDGTVTLTVEK